MGGFVEAFEALGYHLCLSEALEPGLEKIAIYGVQGPDGLSIPTHAALQLPSGEWTSKLGRFEDIRHQTVEGVSGPVYGRARIFMSRPLTSNPQNPV